MSPSTAHSILNRGVRLETKAPFYFMFPIDIDADPVAGGRDIAEIHLDMGAPGRTVSSAFCYWVRPVGRGWRI